MMLLFYRFPCNNQSTWQGWVKVATWRTRTKSRIIIFVMIIIIVVLYIHTHLYLFICESVGRTFYRSFNVWFLSIFFSRLHVQSTRDGRSGKDSLFDRLESRAPFITPVLTVYVISLGERQNGQAERGAKKKLSDPEMEWRSFLIPRSVLHHFSADDVIAIPAQAITTGPYLCHSIFLSVLPSLALISNHPPLNYPSILLFYPAYKQNSSWPTLLVAGKGYRNFGI